MAKVIKAKMENEGCTIAYIFGEIGVGKTSYALYTAHEIYGNWKEPLEWLFFDIKDLLPRLSERFLKGERVPLIIIDDAGLWANRMYWWELPVKEFTKLFNVIRSMAGGVIFTSPSDEIPRQLIKKVKYRIFVSRAGSKDGTPLSRAIIYDQYILPDFRPVVKKVAEEIFPTHYPVYEEYAKKRNTAITTKLKEMESMIELYKKGVKVKGQYTLTRAKFIKLVIGKATEMVKEGKTIREVKKWITSFGIPDGTADHWVKRIKIYLKNGVDPVDVALSGAWRIKVGPWMHLTEKIERAVTDHS